ncbi:MAG TPA: GNAT family N-acetyltransferase [Solirubrobacteraceae bacterium]
MTELRVALEAFHYGQSALSQADVEDEWSDLDIERNTRVVRDGECIVGYGAVRQEGELWKAEGCVHPDALGRGIGRLIATGLEEHAACYGARRIHSAPLEVDSAARGLLESLGYSAVRIFREMRIELQAPPSAPRWPDGFRVVQFDAERDAVELHAAAEEAFADHWEHTPCEFELWSKRYLGSERFDPTLWCVVRAGAEIAAGTICTGDTYGGGWVHMLFTRRAWRKHGVGTALLSDSFARFWERGERSVGLGVDAASNTGAFRLYERAGMSPLLGFVVFEKDLDDHR